MLALPASHTVERGVLRFEADFHFAEFHNVDIHI
jgi:hypothetical protein